MHSYLLIIYVNVKHEYRLYNHNNVIIYYIGSIRQCALSLINNDFTKNVSITTI